MTNKTDYRLIEELGSSFLREHAYQHGESISSFMKAHGIGESEYGKLMDAALRGNEVMSHRLYGHHILYDFPVKLPQKYWDFMEHEFSDLFTKQGLPILPGPLVENSAILKYCDRLTKNWNFLNGFDILTGTISLVNGIKSLSRYRRGADCIDTIEVAAKEIGIGAVELAIAVSSANPLLLIAGLLQLTAACRGMMNDRTVIILNNLMGSYSIGVEIKFLTLEQEVSELGIQSEIDGMRIKDEVPNAT